MNNVYLVGLPGSGKTTVGRQVAARLGRKLVDIDRLIEEREQATIPELFTRGEDHFRACETAALRAVAELNDCIVATGGGIVEREENRALLEREFVIYINRNLYRLARSVQTETRPLLKQDPNTIYTLARRRRPWYEAVATVRVANNRALSRCVERVLAEIAAWENKAVREE